MKRLLTLAFLCVLFVMLLVKFLDGIETGCFDVSRVGIINCRDAHPFGYYADMAFTGFMTFFVFLITVFSLFPSKKSSGEVNAGKKDM